MLEISETCSLIKGDQKWLNTIFMLILYGSHRGYGKLVSAERCECQMLICSMSPFHNK